MNILHIFREYAEARSATRGRRLYGYVAAAVLVALLTVLILTRSPAWVFWAVAIPDAIVDTILVRRWMIRDLAHRAREVEP